MGFFPVLFSNRKAEAADLKHGVFILFPALNFQTITMPKVEFSNEASISLA